MLDTGGSKTVYAVVFHSDGKHLLGGGDDGIRRWRLSDGLEVGRQTEMQLHAIHVSKDHKWVVCGTSNGASVWDAEIDENVITVEGGNTVWAVDVSPDSTRFATGTGKSEVSIWNITTGERLVGPLRHDEYVTGTKFSPNGEHIATTYFRGSIRIFDSRNGDELTIIHTITANVAAITPLAWSSDGQRIFATSNDDKIWSFDVSTGDSRFVELEICDVGYSSIALAPNCKFIATFVEQFISFLDTSTLARARPDIADNKDIRSIAISQDNSYLATGQDGGKIVIRKLSQILPDSYGPFHVSICAFIVSACWTRD